MAKGRSPLHIGCSIEGCDGKHHARGLCNKHYLRFRIHGDPETLLAVKAPQGTWSGVTCKVDGCERSVSTSHGWCGAHWRRFKKYGDPTIRVRRPNYEISLREDGYLESTKNGVRDLEHRHIMREMLGRDLLPGEEVHHKNLIRSDNRPENLELWSNSQPTGARVSDLLAWAHELIKTYEGDIECSD